MLQSTSSTALLSILYLLNELPLLNTRNREMKAKNFISIAESQPLSANLNTVNLVMNFITTPGTELFYDENRMLGGKLKGKLKMVTD